jgi:hypothetical protein
MVTQIKQNSFALHFMVYTRSSSRIRIGGTQGYHSTVSSLKNYSSLYIHQRRNPFPSHQAPS